MAPLGALSQAWTSAEAALPLDWRISGLYRIDDLSIGLAEGLSSTTTPAAQGCSPSRRCGG